MADQDNHLAREILLQGRNDLHCSVTHSEDALPLVFGVGGVYGIVLPRCEIMSSTLQLTCAEEPLTQANLHCHTATQTQLLVNNVGSFLSSLKVRGQHKDITQGLPIAQHNCLQSLCSLWAGLREWSKSSTKTTIKQN